MSDSRDRTPLLERAEWSFAAVVVGLCVVVWALTSGFAYFWPVWTMIGLAVPLGMAAAIRFVDRRWIARRRTPPRVAAVIVVISLAEIAVWLASGAGYFWPVWSLVACGLLVGMIWAGERPGRRSLETRVDELTRSRSGVLDVQASELRRIERDLHDGAQARLVALSMKLGRAEQRLADHPETAELLRQSRADAAAAITELRDLARGIAPPVLADRGLEAAVRSLADRVGPRVAVEATLVRRPPPVVETAAYFVVAEALTNAAKHAPGSEVRVTLTETGAELLVEVTDYGPGGAVPTSSGLTGLRQRVEALDGRLEIVSPPGVGTMIEAVLPCAS